MAKIQVLSDMLASQVSKQAAGLVSNLTNPKERMLVWSKANATLNVEHNMGSLSVLLKSNSCRHHLPTTIDERVWLLSTPIAVRVYLPSIPIDERAFITPATAAATTSKVAGLQLLLWNNSNRRSSFIDPLLLNSSKCNNGRLPPLLPLAECLLNQPAKLQPLRPLS